MVWCVSYISLEAVDCSLYKCGGEGVFNHISYDAIPR